MSAVGRVINGKECLFPRLKAKQVVDFCELAYQFYRKTLLEDKASGDDVASGMDALRKIRGDRALLWRYIWTTEGAMAVIAASVPEPDYDAIGVDQLCELAGDLAGFDMTPVTKVEGSKPEAGDGFVRPPPAAVGTT